MSPMSGDQHMAGIAVAAAVSTAADDEDHFFRETALKRRAKVKGQNSQNDMATVKKIEKDINANDLQDEKGGKFWQFSWFTPIYVCGFVFGLLVLRKTNTAISAVQYVRSCQYQVSQEALENSGDFHHLLTMLDSVEKPPAIMMLNQYALKMTNNFLCNTAQMPGVHERLVFVTLDKVASDVMTKEWPHVKQFYWPTPCLYKRFSFAEGAYQVIYLLRANLAASLIRYGRSFWMMQQDTFWRENLFTLDLESHDNYDLLFDQIGDSTDSQRAEWVNGANFYVRANNRTLEFFQAMAGKLAHWYTPDMAIMIHQCHTWGNESNCNYMPHRIAHSWEWMYTAQKNPPYIMQLDCETDAGSKLDQLARFGFRFTHEDGRTCNQEAVDLARHRMNTGTVDVRRAMLSWGRFQFIVYWYITDFMLWFPVIGQLIKPYLPLVGFCIMITF